MAREAGRSDEDPLTLLDPQTTVLVVGGAEDAHQYVCGSFVDRPSVERPLRLCLDPECERAHVASRPDFERGPGEYRGLSLPQAGIVATEAMLNFDHATDATGVHACLCGVPKPSSPDGRRAVFRFLHAFSREVDGFGGGAHVHLPVATDAEFTELVAPLFDEVVEVRDGPEVRVRRWDEPGDEWRAVT